MTRVLAIVGALCASFALLALQACGAGDTSGTAGTGGASGSECARSATMTDCPPLQGADLATRCADRLTDSTPALWRSGCPCAGAYPPLGGLFVSTFECGDGSTVELWCVGL